MTGILDINGKPIRWGDVVINHAASASSSRRIGVVIVRGSSHIKLTDLKGSNWKFTAAATQLEIVGFLDLDHAKERRPD